MVNENEEQKSNEKIGLPYDVTLTIAESIVKDLDRVGSKGMKVGELFKRIAIKSKPLKSHALDWCKFFKLVSTDGRTVSLSSLGYQYAHASVDQKNDVLAQNLPERYLTILKWISDSQDAMRVEQIKDLMVSNWNFVPSKRLSDSMLNTFARTCESIGLIKHIKGPNPRVELTKKGFDVLSLPPRIVETLLPDSKKSLEDFQITSTGVTNKIIILTEYGRFETPASDIEDWNLAEMRLKAWKKKWEENKQTKGIGKP